ncbi:MAG: hypothetical protein CMI02_01150 [Oceanospirillaceae bacterium]|nr:hypothetical protein [Oceanospirillaceae bacterium]MBT10626.1 hypothetical protein [Oceanospirillaceae bacterium]|tara:strand:+ start:36658 stop:37236 length:579 start_codon:yes stop_codon:yes gene_type:complete
MKTTSLSSDLFLYLLLKKTTDLNINKSFTTHKQEQQKHKTSATRISNRLFSLFICALISLPVAADESVKLMITTKQAQSRHSTTELVYHPGVKDIDSCYQQVTSSRRKDSGVFDLPPENDGSLHSYHCVYTRHSPAVIQHHMQDNAFFLISIEDHIARFAAADSYADCLDKMRNADPSRHMFCSLSQQSLAD